MQIKRTSNADWNGTGKKGAAIPGISEDKILELIQDTGANCPVPKLLNCEISLNSQLN